MTDNTDEADELDTPDGWDESSIHLLQEKAELMEADPDVDMDANVRQDQGWMRFYVECPDCNTPMVRTAVESASAASGESTSEFRAICPDCREMGSTITVERETAPLSDL